VPGVAGSVTDGITRAAAHHDGVIVCQCGRVLVSRLGSEDARGLEGRGQQTPSAQPTASLSLHQAGHQRPASSAWLPQLSALSLLPATQSVASSSVQQHEGDASQIALQLHHARVMQSTLQLLAEGMALGLTPAESRKDAMLKGSSVVLMRCMCCLSHDMICRCVGAAVAGPEVCRADLSSLALQLHAALPEASAPPPGAGSRMDPVAEHGNYRRYYHYRVPDAFSEDPRLKVGPCLIHGA